MDFENVISLLNEGKTDEVKSALESFKPEFEKTVGDLRSFESRFNEAKDGRDKVKGRLKELSEALGVSVDDLSAERVKELVKGGKGDDVSKAEIEKLTKLLQAKDDEYTSKLTQSEARFRDKVIEGDIAKLGLNANVVNDKALGLVIQALKEGATIEGDVIVYKEADGSISRNSVGQPITIAQKMAQFQNDPANAFLFKATSGGGGGSTGGSSGGHGGNRSLAGAKTKEERIKIIESRIQS